MDFMANNFLCFLTVQPLRTIFTSLLEKPDTWVGGVRLVGRPVGWAVCKIPINQRPALQRGVQLHSYAAEVEHLVFLRRGSASLPTSLTVWDQL